MIGTKQLFVQPDKFTKNWKTKPISGTSNVLWPYFIDKASNISQRLQFCDYIMTASLHLCASLIWNNLKTMTMVTANKIVRDYFIPITFYIFFVLLNSWKAVQQVLVILGMFSSEKIKISQAFILPVEIPNKIFRHSTILILLD